MCTRGPAKTPVESAKEKLIKLHGKKNVQRPINYNFAHVVKFVHDNLSEETTQELLAKWRDNWRHTTDVAGRKSGVEEFNKILDELAPKLITAADLEQQRASLVHVEVEQAPPPVTFSKPPGAGSDKIMEVAELIDESNAAKPRRTNNCSIL